MKRELRPVIGMEDGSTNESSYVSSIPILGCIGCTSSDLPCPRADVLAQRQRRRDNSDHRDRPCCRSRVWNATVRLMPTCLAPTFCGPPRWEDEHEEAEEMTAAMLSRH